ncbi:MAG: 23S rRNA (adenine(2503)-C(2))-methyltransferase RlmN [Anaerolineae bacterium]|nr:23S rRNA (adenine(2503)-C(2))-methyltransferase RlmN [Anaerolineae bacterium]
MNTKPFFFDLNLDALKAELKTLGLPEFRAKQLFQAFYGELVSSVEEVTTLSKDLRQTLSDKIDFSRLTRIEHLQSTDKETAKMLFGLIDGRAVETVLMHYDERQTLCISSQAGCAMGCVFCATGQMGFARNLTSGEIVEQVLHFARELKKTGQNVTNIVIMGMGEPFHNYDAVMTAVDLLNDPLGLNLGARRITISTVGLVPEILRFAEEKRQVNLAISLHAANDELRASLLPIDRKYPLYELMQACREYINITHRRLTFEWALISDVNDQDKDAYELVKLLKGMICHVNIIQLNPTKKYRGKTPSHERALAFQAILTESGIPCTIRLRRGIDIHAGCGQLAEHQRKSEKTEMI